MTVGEADAVRLLTMLDAEAVWFGLAGGWGVDALAGRMTRAHADLDLIVAADRMDDTVRLLTEDGYQVATDWLPVRLELHDGDGRAVDLHPAHPDGAGGHWQAGLGDTRYQYPPEFWTTGRIGGRPVRCATVEGQLAVHAGYPPRDVDRHDVALLHGLAAQCLQGRPR